MGEYTKLCIKRYAQLDRRRTAEDRRWSRLEFSSVTQEKGPVNWVDFSSAAPHDFAVSTGTCVQLYSALRDDKKRSIRRFKDTVYSGSYRQDGRLLVAGDGTGLVQVFNTSTRAALRRFRGHEQSVHVTKFSLNNSHVWTCSDDTTVRCWDLPTESEVCVLRGHQDHVRAGVTCARGPHMFLSGGYDHIVNLWDTRTGKSALKVDHGAPVEAVVMFPNGGAFISAGRNYFKVWNALNTQQVICKVAAHQKTIMTLCFDGTRQRLLSGALDRHVKVYDIVDYKLQHSMRYPAPVLSMNVAPDDGILVVGMTSGLLSIRKRVSTTAAPLAKRQTPRPGTHRYFVRGQTHRPEEGDFVPETGRRRKLRDYDKLLKKFRYYEALDAVLTGSYRPVVVVSVIHELIQRAGLKRAMSGRDERSLKPLLTFVVKNVTNPRYISLLIDVATAMLDMYAPGMGQSVEIDELFVRLRLKLQEEVRVQKLCFELLGTIETLVASNGLAC